MARTLIPRSDSVSAKIIEPSDFENLFTSDIVQDYIKSGFTLSAGSGLACNVAAGVIRFKGLYLQSDATEAVTVSASTTNAIYVKINRDGNGEAESWTFSISSSGDTFQIGNAVTDGSGVTSVNTSNNPATKPGVFALNTALGGGTAGDILYSNGTNWTKIAKGSDGQYLKLASGVPTWTTHTTPTTTITVQEDSMDADMHEGNGLPTTIMSVTLPTRSGGYFMACASLTGSGDIHAYFKQGSTTISPRIGTGANETTDEQFSIFATGSLDGQVLSVYGGIDGNGSFSGSTDGDDGGYCHMTVFEVSQTS